MTSPNNQDSSDHSYNNLVAKALRYIARRGQRANTLAQQLSDARLERDFIAAGIDGDATPIEVSHVMRGPVGPDQLATVVHDGMLIKAMLRPSGKRNPAREAAVWRCMRDAAYQVREEHHGG